MSEEMKQVPIDLSHVFELLSNKKNDILDIDYSNDNDSYPTVRAVKNYVDVIDDKVSVVYNTVSIIDASDSVYDADRWTEYGPMSIGQNSNYKFIGGGNSGYVIYDGNISNLDNYDITLNLQANRKNTNLYINDDDNIGTLPTSQTSILFKKRDGVVKVVYDNNQYDASAVKIVAFNIMSLIRYTIDVVLYQGMIYDVIDSIPSKTSDLTNDSGFITSSNVPSASSVTPSADTTNGSVGDGTTWARSNHTHPKSSLYAEASHTHPQYLTSHQDITGKEDKSNKVTSLSSSSTDTQYPSAKIVYDSLNNLHTSNIKIAGEPLTNIWTGATITSQATLNTLINNHIGEIDARLQKEEIVYGSIYKTDSSRVYISGTYNKVCDSVGPQHPFLNEMILFKLPNDLNSSSTKSIQIKVIYYTTSYASSQNFFELPATYNNVAIKENTFASNTIILLKLNSSNNGFDIVGVFSPNSTGSYTDLTDKPTIPSIVDNLTTNDATKVLSAKQGKVLNDLIGDAITYINGTGGN